MCDHALLTILGEIVVPVGKSRSKLRSKVQSIHSHSTGEVCLASARDALLAEHGHCHAGSAAIVYFERIPALHCHTVHFVCLNPVFYGNTELSLCLDFVVISLRNCGISADGSHLSMSFGSSSATRSAL